MKKKFLSAVLALSMLSVCNTFTAVADDVITTTVAENVETTTFETTTTTTLPQYIEEDFYNPPDAFSITLDFFDVDTAKIVSVINGRIEKWTFADPGTHFSAFDEHETEIIQEFEITENNAYKLPEIETDKRFNCAYMIVVDELPQDYLYAESNRNYFTREIKIDSSDIKISVPLKYSPVPENYPLNGTYLSNIHFVDQYAYEDVDLDLECVLFNVNTGEELAKWNTSEYPKMEVELQYYFETHISPDKYNYAVKVLNFPENIGFTYTAVDLESNEMYINTISRDSTDEEEILDNPVRINIPGKEPPEDYFVDNPITSMVTTATTTSETTATTTVAVDSTEPATTQTTVNTEVISSITSPIDTTVTTTIPIETDEELPQTGYSNIYKVFAGLASVMTITGTAIIINSKKKDE